MKQRTLTRIVLSAAATLLAPALSQASPDFPGEIAFQLTRDPDELQELLDEDVAGGEYAVRIG